MTEFGELRQFKPRHTITIERHYLAPVIPIDSIVFADEFNPVSDEDAAFIKKILEQLEKSQPPTTHIAMPSIDL